MQTLDIILQKRSTKVFLYIIAVFLIGLWVAQLTVHLLQGNHEWYNIVFEILLGGGLIYMGQSLYQYFTTKEMRLVAESEGNTITFRYVNDLGKVSNRQEVTNLDKMKRFYVVKKRTRYMMDNYSFKFEGEGLLSNEDIEFPSLFECTEADRNKVLAFVNTVAPHIELGYENLWQRISKK